VNPAIRLALAGSVIIWPLGAPAQAATGEVSWAVNIAGPAYRGSDGTEYEAESGVSGGATDKLENIKGSQDPMLYGTFREGDLRIARPGAAREGHLGGDLDAAKRPVPLCHHLPGG
jgi:hypothetical protein